MTITVAHSPGEIITQLIIDLGLATPVDSDSEWPVYFSRMPDAPDECLCVKDRDGLIEGQTMIDGESQEVYGFQVLFRSRLADPGRLKAQAVARAFDFAVKRTNVILAPTTYRVWSVTLSSPILSLGAEPPDYKRRLFSLNALATMDEVEATTGPTGKRVFRPRAFRTRAFRTRSLGGLIS